MNRFKSWPKWMQIQEIIVLCFVILYILGIVTGGLFTSFYGMMALGVVGSITAIISLIKKQFLIGLINFALAFLGFIIYINIPV